MILEKREEMVGETLSTTARYGMKMGLLRAHTCPCVLNGAHLHVTYLAFINRSSPSLLIISLSKMSVPRIAAEKRRIQNSEDSEESKKIRTYPVVHYQAPYQQGR